jgi:hypothetical protein
MPPFTAMARSEILISLERQYAIALGHFEVAEHAIEPVIGLKAVIAEDARIQVEKKKLKLKMERLAHLIKVQVDPDWHPGHIRPIQPRKRSDRRGEVSKAAYRVLKTATTPMRVREIAHLVAAQLGMENPHYTEINKLDSLIHVTLNGRLKDDMVMHDGGTPKRWSVKPRQRPQFGWAA